EEAGCPEENILHLHGDLHNKEELIIRLNQVGRMLDPRLKGECLDKLAGKDLVILGYSGRDQDIMKLVQDANPARIIWLVRGQHDLALRAVDSLPASCHAAVVLGDLSLLGSHLRGRDRKSTRLNSSHVAIS